MFVNCFFFSGGDQKAKASGGSWCFAGDAIVRLKIIFETFGANNVLWIVFVFK